MCESMYIHIHLNFTCIIMFNGNLNSFLDLISTYNLSNLPNFFNKTFDFVYTNVF